MADYTGAFTGGRKVQNFGINNANKGTTNNFQQPIRKANFLPTKF